MIRNNVTRYLAKKKIAHQTFELPKEKLGALETAKLLNVPPEIVFKTIVVERPNKRKPILAVIPGPKAVDLKLLAKFLGEKKLKIATLKNAERLTGLKTGGISPLALINRGFEVIIDESANQFKEIHISGGQRGLNILLPTDSLGLLTNAKFAEISKQNQAA
ncbi:MAG: hypothetical protein J7L73_04810 [Anaerolineales bacterium]|nr:hypothetical protein [Anaerolineales bacterium]